VWRGLILALVTIAAGVAAIAGAARVLNQDDILSA
jgi:hypothetical protein